MAKHSTQCNVLVLFSGLLLQYSTVQGYAEQVQCTVQCVRISAGYLVYVIEGESRWCSWN